ncbi:hypothetical protein CHLRE_10g450800v5 [Chlamydomonas reinhardtii]|uniref:Uncharacterized protein n=1 Tax=Chlamydomonas reinhardtii TaxID=3055 RepID=A8HZV2_CHLRE|nr:uncharacterized protein CHLRE_10g450800v5 [Chlamydomonas reinhardtii]PNW77765.1 hypothetical protein CHLRE_10g450800v5 [Chlamydomonas reinhardtii]|eukprot:XP_001698330.1 predicted protein [Chlamydomonas reinhardtii]
MSKFIRVAVCIPGPPKVEADKAKLRSPWASFRPASPAPYRPSLNSPPRSPASSVAGAPLLHPRPLPTSPIETYQWNNKFMLANPPLFHVDPDEPDADLLADLCNLCQVSCPRTPFTPEEDARATAIAKAICSGAITTYRTANAFARRC